MYWLVLETEPTIKVLVKIGLVSRALMRFDVHKEEVCLRLMLMEDTYEFKHGIYVLFLSTL